MKIRFRSLAGRVCPAFFLLFFAVACPAAEPTLARLSFRVPPERMAEFESVYRAKVAPLLKRHGLSESSRRGRATVDSVFSRLIEVKTPSWMVQTQEALDGDLSWSALLQDLGKRFGTADPDGLIRHRFDLYAVPAGSGKVVPAGRGKGHWRTYDVTDGFGGGNLGTVLQDRQGYLWIATGGRGVSRYDGETWITLTTQDGLAGNSVWSILQDREGNLWFGTNGGVSRYDGQTWTTLKDGLVSNGVGFGILQDREGALWFSTQGGVSRYDGQTWTTFTPKDGLANNQVWSIFQDREGMLWFGTRRGVSRYDGQIWTTFTPKDGPADNLAYSILQDREGDLWFSTRSGVSRYDGKSWTTFTTNDGLASNNVWAIFEDRGGRPLVRRRWRCESL